MAEQRFNPEHIIEFAEQLRLAGFDIGTQQHIAAQDLLIALAAHNRLPADPSQWRTLLAPIFCASPAEQEEFYARFDLWLKRHPEWIPVADGMPDASSREITLPAASIRWIKKPVGIASVALLILVIGFAAFLSLKTNRALTVEVFSSEGGKSLPDAKVEFFNQPAKSEGDGKFTVSYQARNWHRIFNRQVADLTVAYDEHDPHTTTGLDVHQPSHQTVTLQKRKPQTPPKSTISLPPTAEATPQPIPLLPQFNAPKPKIGGTPNTIRWYHWLLVALPLLLFAAWMLLRWRRRRSLLQKLQAAGSPNLRRLKVRGASERLFQSQTFRRAVQDLRRHRRVGVRDLDVHATVQATIDRGGMFAPRYGSRKALPEYLLLIDRANLADEQARFADELSQRLEDGGVFVDRFYFQSDPRSCRPREANSATVTLLDLAARYPEHQLLVFSDGEGFISPLTGEAEHWLTMFSHWSGKIFLTPELASQPGYRELALMENDFLVLPANDDGLFILTETINAGMTPNLKATQRGKGENSLFPRLVMEHPRRWVERHAPRPAAMSQLLDQLRAYLGEDGWYWLAACAVYPALSWDVTLYLGYKLINRVSNPTVKEGLSFEERLLRLIRLPWFRYGSMPDWLRLRLIESFTPEQEREVRQTIESMLLSALENPQEGVPLEIAEREPVKVSWLQRLKAKLDARRQRKKLADLIEREPEESPLKDFVFLGFLSRTSARRLTVKLPDLLNRLLFPEGQAVLGFRPATAAALAILLAVAGVAFVVNWSQRIAPPPPTLSQFYQDWDQIEQSRFVAESVKQVLTALADSADTMLSLEDYELIQQKVSDYAARVGNGFTSEPEDLGYVFGRGVKYAPEISAEAQRTKQREVPTFYLAMLKSEFRRSDTALWAFPSAVPGVSSDAALRSVAGFVETSGNIFASLNMMNGSVWKLLAYDNQQERAERTDYVYRFLAAAIVGENPRSFGLDMNPLSSYAQAGLVAPSPTPSATPTPTPTPRSVACLTEKDLQGQYLIHSILAKDANGQITDIGEQYPLGPNFIGKPFSDATARKIPGDAGAILDAEKISLQSINTCATLVNPNECRKSNMGVRCVDVILTEGTPAGKDGQNPVQGPPPPFTVTKTAEGYSVELGKGVRPLELVNLRGGTFTMGSNKGGDDEKPPHQVQVSPFAMGQFEVTQAQWKAVMDGKNPSRFKGDDLPVESVSWDDVQEFIKRLNEKTGSQQFRLPTEAEWEYACRAGTDTEYSFGDDEKLLGDYAWYSGNSGSKTHPVGGKKANGFNLFDMHGNVWEWCSDWYDENYYNQLSKQGVAVNPRGPAKGEYRVVRGGSWNDDVDDCRSADRVNYQPGNRDFIIGFRVVL